mmetsp:Transcript_14669/g.10551  ORF Transcript_14669/g.10551 Transcript_14669/m.10551 type:complete len:168 (-) Transcript_14669:61-564(-)
MDYPSYDYSWLTSHTDGTYGMYMGFGYGKDGMIGSTAIICGLYYKGKSNDTLYCAEVYFTAEAPATTIYNHTGSDEFTWTTNYLEYGANSKANMSVTATRKFKYTNRSDIYEITGGEMPVIYAEGAIIAGYPQDHLLKRGETTIDLSGSVFVQISLLILLGMMGVIL